MADKALTTIAPLIQCVPADKALPLPRPDDVVTVPVGGAFGDVPMTYQAFMGVVRSALKSRIGKQLDVALEAHSARAAAVTQAAQAAPEAPKEAKKDK